MIAPRSALFLPASNPRAVAKARTLAADMVILDLEDAVATAGKAAARDAAVAAVADGFGERAAAIRINASDTEWHAADAAAVAGSAADVVVLPKVESAAEAARVVLATAKPVFVMIETPAGVFAAPAIAAVDGVAGLIAGTNDLSHALRIPGGRAGLSYALQAIVLAARSGGCVALDGVWNRLDDPDGFAAECREGRSFGYDGKTLIHPSQVDPCNAAFAPDAAELEEAQALVAAATAGAARFRDRMVEDLHVAAARALLARAGAAGQAGGTGRTGSL